MAQSIGLAVKVGADLSGLQQGTRLARNEVRQLGSIMRQAEPNAEKLEKKTNLLNRALDNGEIQARQHGQAMDFLRRKYADTAASSGNLRGEITSQIPVVNNLTSSFGGMHPAAVGVGLAFGAIAAAGATVNKVLGDTLEKMQELDVSIKAARSIGEDFADLTRLQLGLAESTGLGAEEVNKSLSGLGRRIGETAAGTGEAKIAFQQLGLSVDELSRLDPTEQFRRVGEALQGVESKTRQLFIANKLFEEQGAKLLPGLLAQGDAFDASARAADTYGLTLTKVQTNNIEAANDSLGRMSMIWDGITTQVGAELAPEIVVISQTIEHMLKSMGGVRLQVDLMVRGLRETYIHVAKLANIDVGIMKALSGNFSGAKESFSAAGNVRKNLDDLQKINEFISKMDDRRARRQQDMIKLTEASELTKDEMDKKRRARRSSYDEVAFARAEQQERMMERKRKARGGYKAGAYDDMVGQDKALGFTQATVGSQEAYKFLTGQMKNADEKLLSENQTQTDHLEGIRVATEQIARGNGGGVNVRVAS